MVETVNRQERLNIDIKPGSVDVDFDAPAKRAVSIYVNGNSVAVGTVNVDIFTSPNGTDWFDTTLGGTTLSSNFIEKYSLIDKPTQKIRVAITQAGSVAADGVLTLTGNLTGIASASGVYTLSANVSADDTVTIGSQVYTFKASLTTTPTAYEVLIGATASDTLDNLIAAINRGAGEATLYGGGTEAHPDVTASQGAGDTMDIDAKVAGVAANSIATTESGLNSSWGAATMENGADAETVTIGGIVYTAVAALSGSPYEVLIGATASDTIDNLIAAIMNTAGEGSTYGTGTKAHPDITAAAGVGDTMDIDAKIAGVVGNSIATTETSSSASWGAATMQNGVDGATGSVDVILIGA